MQKHIFHVTIAYIAKVEAANKHEAIELASDLTLPNYVEDSFSIENVLVIPPTK